MGEDISETEEGSDSDEKGAEEQESEDSFDDVPWGDESDDSVPVESNEEESNEEESNEEENASTDGLNKNPENNFLTPVSLLDSRAAALVEEKRWKGIDEKFLSTGLRLLHILNVLSILFI